MKLKRVFVCNVMLFVAMFFGMVVSFMAQDTQSLEIQERRLIQKIARDAERIKILEAEWAYLTRPEYLQSLILKDDHEWRTYKGSDMVAWNQLVQKEPSQLASTLSESTPYTQ